VSFCERLEARHAGLREVILRHPFVTGVGDGSLPVEAFKWYVRQDYAYLIEYARVLALASAKGPDLESMGWFAGLLHETLNTEMALHRGYCARFGITEQELERTEAAPTTVAYTRFLLATAHQGSLGELAAALLPCQWGYCEIGTQLARRGLPGNAPLYAEWIRMYSSPEFVEIGQRLRSLVDGAARSAGEAERARMESAYRASLRYELAFWEAAYRQEAWPA